MKRIVTAIVASAMFAGATYAQDVTVSSNITTDTVWTSDNQYILDGFITVANGANLTIEPGTVIKANAGTGPDASALIIARNSKIFAAGTPNRPIVFTSVNDPQDGSWTPANGSAWGGLIVLGNAPINSNRGGQGAFPGLEGQIEGVPEALGADSTTFGGTDEDDSSGIIRYISIRFGGSALEANAEINGLSLGGVGRGTVIEFVEIFANSDDGIEWFGGNVDARYMVSAFGGDDGFDYDQGWTGRGQFWFYIAGPDLNDNLFNADNGGEHDGETNSQGGPVGGTNVFNATFIGAATNGDFAFQIRDNGFAKYSNSIFTEFGDSAVRIESDSADQIADGSMEFRNNIWWNFNGDTDAGFGNTVADMAHGDDDANDGIDDDESFIWNTAEFLNEIEDPMIVSIDRGQNGLLDPRPAADSPALANALNSITDSWYRSVSYQGAFSSSSNWLYGWTYLDEGGYLVPQNNASSAQPINVSTLTEVAAGGTVTAGFVVEGELPRAFLVRAVGAKLADLGVADASSDTSLVLNKINPFNSEVTVIGEIEDWDDDGMGNLVAGVSRASGAFALDGDTTSAAGYFILEPGNYTVVATNKDGSAASLIIEVWDVDS